MSRAPRVRARISSSGAARPKSVNARRTASTVEPNTCLRFSRAQMLEPAIVSSEPWKMRHHVAREQLVAAQRLLAIGPFMRAEQDAAEAALAVFQQPADALDHRLRRADQRRAHLHAVAQRIVGAARRTAERVLEIGLRLDPLALLHLAQRLLVVLGDVRVDHDAPVLAVHGLAVLRRGVLGDLPLAGQRLRPARQAGADRQHADAVRSRRRSCRTA